MHSSPTAFCVECGRKKPYSVTSTRETLTIRGVSFQYVERQARCQDCGEVGYVPEINDANVKSREDAYRKAAGLITISEINEILDKYNIGAGPLAKLLGLGDVTINRYLSGQLPSKKNSDLLLKIRSSHKAMEEYLEEGKGKISSAAYRKCRLKIDALNQLCSNNKIEVVTRYLLCKAGDVTPLALQKLLYFAQAFYNAIFGNELFLDDCQAWAYGPVYPEVYYKYQPYGYDPITKPTDAFCNDFSSLTAREIDFLDAIIDSFGDCSGTVLSNITHHELPWLEARGALLPKERSDTIIKRDTINKYFHEVIEKYEIVNPCDISKYCSAMREQVK